ncbi:hypothetical protein BFW01_g11697 [Lasiodiplodia theobromae]|nr:hypothetical protein BFW01_g11697 [Lasiodiplodia theobromae]
MDAIIIETKAQMDAAADHIWLLQTQSSYMRRYVRSIQQNAVLNELGSDEILQVMVGELFHDIIVVWFWQSVLDEFYNAKNLHGRFRDNIAPGQPLPRKYHEALGALELLLVNSMHSQSKHLQEIIPQRPGFHHLWTFERIPGGKFTMKRKTNNSITKLFDEDPLDWCLMQLQGAPDEQRRFDYGMLFDFLDEHLAQCSAKERARLDEILFAKLSTYAATSELLCAIRLHRPQNKFRDVLEVIQNNDRLAWRFYVRAKEPPQDAQSTMATLLKKFCDVGPSSGRRDTASLKHFEATNRTLQDFWRSVATALRAEVAEQNLPEGDVEKILGFLLGHESPEHLKALQAEKERILREIEVSAAPAGGEASFGTESSVAAVAKPDIQQRKTKVKTRPQDTPKQPGTQITMAHKRSFDVFMAMFPASGQEASRLVDWDTFVLAMSDAGFSARNNGGSAVVFQNNGPETSAHGGKIIFHKPHPVPKIDPVMLHSMGKRMNRWFDWRRDTFILGSS